MVVVTDDTFFPSSAGSWIEGDGGEGFGEKFGPTESLKDHT
jgi:hypothetical protein